MGSMLLLLLLHAGQQVHHGAEQRDELRAHLHRHAAADVAFVLQTVELWILCSMPSCSCCMLHERVGMVSAAACGLPERVAFGGSSIESDGTSGAIRAFFTLRSSRRRHVSRSRKIVDRQSTSSYKVCGG